MSVSPGRRHAVGEVISPRDLRQISGPPVPIPSPDRLVHLQLRRFAGCPVCNLHLRSVIARRGEIEEAGILEVIVFHSSAQDLRTYEGDVPFPVVADPDKHLYRALGAESAPRALGPRAWGAIVRGVLRSSGDVLRGRAPLPPLRPAGGSLGLPAEFLIGSDGTLAAVKYGEHADDQWSVDELLAHARRAPVRTT